jgi:hypothetical protein
MAGSSASSINETNTGAPGNQTELYARAFVSQALFSLPQTTISIEYDNLAQLRKSPEYTALRGQYSGASFKQVESLFSKIGIIEANVQEIATASSGSNLYGIVRGTFNGTQVMKQQLQSGVSLSSLRNQQALCSGDGLCVLFLANSVAVFGSIGDLETILDVRDHQSEPLAANRPIAQLLAEADFSAPVIGVAPGDELTSWISTGLAKELSSQLSGSSALNTVRLFQYSVTLGSKARVNMYFDCSSSLAAGALAVSLRSLNALSSFASRFASNGSALAFENVSVSASANYEHLSLDTAIH